MGQITSRPAVLPRWLNIMVTPAVSCHILCAALSVMHIQEWLRSLRPGSGIKGSDLDDLWNLLPSLPLSSSLSSLSLSPSSLLGLGALASLTVYWLVTRPRPMRPPCDLQAQSMAVDVSGNSKWCVCFWLCVCVCVFNTLTAPLTAGRPQLQALGSACRRLAAGVLLRWHQDFLRHVPEGPEDRRWRTETTHQY